MKRFLSTPQVGILVGIIVVLGGTYLSLDSDSEATSTADVRILAEEDSVIVKKLKTLNPEEAYLESLEMLMGLTTPEAFTNYINIYFPKLSLQDIRRVYADEATAAGKDVDTFVFELIVPLMQQTHPSSDIINIMDVSVDGTIAELAFTAPGGLTGERTGEAIMVFEDGYWKLLASQISN